MEHSRLDFTAAGTANDFFHTFPNYISGKNILSNVFSYAGVAALILLLIIILPCLVRILQQSIQRFATELHLAVLRNKNGEMPGAGERHSTRDKGHEEGGWAYTKAGSSLGSPPGYS